MYQPVYMRAHEFISIDAGDMRGSCIGRYDPSITLHHQESIIE